MTRKTSQNELSQINIDTDMKKTPSYIMVLGLSSRKISAGLSLLYSNFHYLYKYYGLVILI